MTTFDVADACIDLEIDLELDDLSILFPGGASLSIPSAPGIDISFASDYGKQILASVNAALMPLQPIFNLIDLLLVIVEFAQAIPDCLGPPPDPTKLIAIVPKLKKKLDKLLKMIPPLSIPAFIKSLLRAIIVFLRGLKASLTAVLTLEAKIDLGRLRATELQGLAAQGKIAIDVSLEMNASILCASGSASIMFKGLAQGAAPLDSLLGIVRAFCKLVGLPVEIPVMGNLGASASVAVDAVDVLLVLLTNVRAAIVI